MAEITNDMINVEEVVDIAEDVMEKVPHVGAGKIALLVAGAGAVVAACYVGTKKAIKWYKGKKAVEAERHEGVGEDVVDVDFVE